MMAVLSILLLLALTDVSTGLFYKKHVFYSTQLTWTDAQAYCRKNYIDLSILDTQLEFDSFVTLTAAQKSESCWIGLNKAPSETQFTQWCSGKVLDFTKWKSGQPDHTDTEHCAFTSNNQWENVDCGKNMKSFCYTWSPEMIVVKKMMSWDEALMHCRTHYTDLLSLTSETDYFMVNSRITDIQTPTFWTGLRFLNGSWFWVNQESLLIPPSMPLCPAKPFQCGARNVETGVWENRDCEEKMNFICYFSSKIWSYLTCVFVANRFTSNIQETKISKLSGELLPHIQKRFGHNKTNKRLAIRLSLTSH
ncbi:C-type mannose receptor 2 [Silurus asotus]|uniref:C-type mannose receptor 2 n=1 Tax=Silurus asotus TaxID=30991 RepID=A0AAD5FI27_SILAS|nr:C-type mannose receptor 2 [Silurus asotus]